MAIAISADAWNPSEEGNAATSRDTVMIISGCPYVEPIPSDDSMAGFRLASGRLDAPAYTLDAQLRRIAQPWDLKRGTKFNVLVEPGRSLVKQIADGSAVLVEAPECKTLSRELQIDLSLESTDSLLAFVRTSFPKGCPI